jgi:hypothetical protein
MARQFPTRRALALALPFTLAASMAVAQDSQVSGPVLPPQQPDARSVPEKVDPPLSKTAPDSTGTLSEQLKDSEGVIKPPAGVDPEMHVPAPQTGSGVVIPPPGTNPGDPVQPK